MAASSWSRGHVWPRRAGREATLVRGGARFTPVGEILGRACGLARTVALSAATAAGAVAVVARTTPWPSALMIRAVFGPGAARSGAALARHVPGDLVEMVDEAYDTRGPTG